MKKFFIILILLTATILGLLPLGIGFGSEKVYTRFISTLNKALEEKGQPPIQIKQYDRGYFKANAILTQRQQVSSGSGNATSIPMTIVIKDTIWHLPWFMHFGEHQDEIVKWKNWQDFELPLTFIQNDTIEFHFTTPTAGSIVAPASEAVFNVADYISQQSKPTSFFYSWFPWWPRLNENAIANNVLTVNPHLEVQWKMWFKHNINIGTSTGKNAVEIQDLSVFSNTSLPIFSNTNPLSKTQESVNFSLLSIPSPDNSGFRVNNFSHRWLIDPSDENNFAEINTGIEKLELNGVFRVDDLNFKQIVQKKKDAINLMLSNSAKRLRIEPRLVTAPAASTPSSNPGDSTQTVPVTPPVGATTYQPIIVNLSLMNLPFSEAFIKTLSNSHAAKTDPDYMENILKKILENKPELVINQFAFGFPEGLMEMKGKLGFADTTDITSLLRDPNRLALLKKSLNGQLTLTLPKQRVDRILKNRIEEDLVSEMIANTSIGIQLKAMTVAERNALLDSMTQSQLNDLIAKKVLLLAPNSTDIYSLELAFNNGSVLINGVIMTDQLTQPKLPASLMATDTAGAAASTPPAAPATAAAPASVSSEEPAKQATQPAQSQ
jgi:hypothetical protein